VALWQSSSGYFSLPLPVFNNAPHTHTHIHSSITDTVPCQYMTTLSSNAIKKNKIKFHVIFTYQNPRNPSSANATAHQKIQACAGQAMATISFNHQGLCHFHVFNPLNPELNPICYLLALLAHHFLHVSRIRVKSLTIRLLMSYIYMERLFLMFLDHTRRRTTVGRTPLDE